MITISSLLVIITSWCHLWTKQGSFHVKVVHQHKQHLLSLSDSLMFFALFFFCGSHSYTSTRGWASSGEVTHFWSANWSPETRQWWTNNQQRHTRPDNEGGGGGAWEAERFSASSVGFILCYFICLLSNESLKLVALLSQLAWPRRVLLDVSAFILKLCNCQVLVQRS